MRRYVRLLRYAMDQKWAFAAIAALTALTSASSALQPWPLKILVDYALNGAPLPGRSALIVESIGLSLTPVSLVIAAALGSIGLWVLNSALDVGLTWLWSRTGQSMVFALAATLFARLQRFSWRLQSKATTGEWLSRITGDTWSVYTITDALLISPFRNLFSLVTVGLVAYRLDPALTALSMAVAPLMSVAARYFGPRLRRQSREMREAQSRIMSFVHQTLTSIPIVQAFDAATRNRERYQSMAGEAVAISRRGALVNRAYRLANGLIASLGNAVVLYVGSQHVLAGTMSVGSLLVFVAYLRSIQGAFSGLFGIYGTLKRVEESADRVLDILNAEDEIRDAPGAQPLPAPPTGARGHVLLEDVTFGYAPEHPVLQGVTVEARPGEAVALVGATGAGKTTLASLIPRFSDPWAGRVIVDGQNVRDVTLASLRAQIGIVLQEPYLLPLSIAGNIGYGRPGASLEEIQTAAVAAQADEFIRRLPEGYDTVLGERGQTLSRGQGQRLAIARALLKDAPVLILDEPTSALDAETEAALMAAIERLMTGRTVFIIAHRLSTIRRVDRIYVLEGGTVAESGTPDELLAAKGLYATYHAIQFPSSSPNEGAR